MSGASENDANWAPASAPTAGDDVCVTAAGTYTVTQHQNVTVHSLQVGGTTGTGTASVAVEGVGCSYGSSLTVTTITDISARGRLALTSAGCGGTSAAFTSSGLVTNDGTIDAAAGNGGDRTIQGPVRNNATIAVSAATTYTGSDVLDNRGTITVTQLLFVTNSTLTNTSGSIGVSGSGQVNVVNGSTFNQVGGDATGIPVSLNGSTLHFIGPSGSSSFVAHNTATLIGDLPSGATVTVEAIGCSYASTLTTSGSITNRGSIHLSSSGCGGSTAVLAGPGTITNEGTISFDAGNGGDRYLRSPVVNNGTVNVDQISYYDNGTTFDNRGTVTLTQPLVAAGTTVVNRSGSIAATGDGVVSVTGGGTFEEVDGNNIGNPVVVQNSALRFTGPGSGPFTMHQNTTLGGDVPAGATVTVEAVGCSYASTVTIDGSFVNAGSIRLSSAGCGGSDAELDGAGTITNSGSITSVAANGGGRFMRTDVINTGTITVSQPLTYEGTLKTLDNQGTITLAQPLVANATRVVNRSGSIDATGSGTLSVTGSGTFEEVDGDNTGNPVVVQNSALRFTGTGSGPFTMHQTSTLGGDVPVGAVVTVEAVGCSYTSQVTAEGSFINAGTIRLTSGGCGGSSATLDVPGTVTNTGSISADAGNGGSRYLRADVINTGTITVAEPLYYDRAETTLDNQGTINVAESVSAPAATVINRSGSIGVSEAGSLTLSNGGTFEQVDGSTSGNPVVVENSALRFTGSGSGVFVTHANSTLAGDVPAGSSIAVEGVGCSYASTLTAAGSFTNAGTITLTSAGCGGTSATLSVPGALTNTGTLMPVPANGGTRNVIASVLDNAGTVVLPSGAPLHLDGSFLQEPSGTLQVGVDAATFNGLLDISGTASFDGALRTDTSFSPPAGASFQIANYASATGSFSSTSTTGTQYTVEVGPTGLTISVLKPSAVSLTATPPSPTAAGQPVTFTATVIAVPPETATPTGSVEFRAGATVLDTAALDGSGQASLTTDQLRSGPPTWSSSTWATPPSLTPRRRWSPARSSPPLRARSSSVRPTRRPPGSR